MNIDNFSNPLRAAILAAVEVGTLIAGGRWSRAGQEKAHPTFGIASVTDSDIEGQAAIIARIRSQFPSARFFAEEKGNDYPASGNEELVFSVDSVDGTTPFRHSLPMWCTALGMMQNGIHTGGVVYAPEVLGGLTIAGEKGRGVRLWEHGSNEGVPVRVSQKVPSRPYVMTGVNVLRLGWYDRFLSGLQRNLRPRGIAESGALGLALVAAGRVDALVQSPQLPHDWIGGYAMLREAGGEIRCYHIKRGEMVAVACPTAVDYDYTEERLGFIAGHKELVQELFSTLQRSTRRAQE